MVRRTLHDESDSRLFEVEVWCLEELRKFGSRCPYVMQSRNGPIQFLIQLLKLEPKENLDFLLYDYVAPKTDYQIAKFNILVPVDGLVSPDITKKELNRLINSYLAATYSNNPCNKELLLMNPPQSVIDLFLLKNGPKASSICTSLRLDTTHRERVKLQGRWEPFLEMTRQLLAIMASGQNARVVPLVSGDCDSLINQIIDLRSKGIQVSIIPDDPDC